MHRDHHNKLDDPPTAILYQRFAPTIFAYLRIAFIGDNNNVLVWNAVTGKTLVVHHQHSKFGISSLIWSPNGAFIASAGDTVELWHANTGKTLYTFTKNPHPIRTLSWSPNGKLITSATGPGELGPAPIVLQVWIAS